MDYLDFELEIDEGTGYEYPVRVINSPAGEARATMCFPFGELELENRLKDLQIALLRSGGQRRQSLSREQQTVQEFGRALFNALLVDEVRVRYSMSQEKARLQGKGLRLKLRFTTPEMAALPWEFLYDPRQAEYVCLSYDTPILRYLELPQPIQPWTVTPPLRILGMVVSPTDLADLNVDVEKQRVERALEGLQAEGLVELTWLKGQTWRDLHREMRHGWHIFHFIGHGGFDAMADEGLVMLCDEDGRAQPIHAKQLGRLLANRGLRLVLLNACEGATGSVHDLFSSTASILVQHGLPAVLAMQYPITDRAAIEFSRTFYESLVDGLPVDAAVVESRVAISLAINNTVEWGTPVLFMRSPDGVIFEVQKVKARKQESRLKDKESGFPTGLPGEVYQRLQATLLRCGVFDSEVALRAVFVDGRITPWRTQLPSAGNAAGRVQAVVDYLYDRFNAAGDNALFLFVQVLRDQMIDPGDALYHQLEELASELKAVLKPPVAVQQSASGELRSEDANRPRSIATQIEEQLTAQEQEAAQKARELIAQVDEQPSQLQAARAAVQRWLEVKPGNADATALLEKLATQEQAAAQQARELVEQAGKQPGKLRAARVAVQRWLDMTPGSAEAAALSTRLETIAREAREQKAREKEARRKQQEAEEAARKAHEEQERRARVEAERKAQAEAAAKAAQAQLTELRIQMQAASTQQDWLEVLRIAGQIQAFQPGDADAAQWVTQAREQLRRSVVTAQSSLMPTTCIRMQPVIRGQRLFIVISGTNLSIPCINEVLIGCGDPSSTQIPDLDLDQFGGRAAGVSRQHARLLHQLNRWLLEDLQSTNGTYVNEVRLLPYRPVHIEFGDTLRFGQMSVKWSGDT